MTPLQWATTRELVRALNNYKSHMITHSRNTRYAVNVLGYRKLPPKTSCNRCIRTSARVMTAALRFVMLNMRCDYDTDCKKPVVQHVFGMNYCAKHRSGGNHIPANDCRSYEPEVSPRRTEAESRSYYGY